MVSLVAIELQDDLDVVELEAENLAQAIFCAHAAAASDMNGGIDYLTGTLAVVLIAARQLHEKAATLSAKLEVMRSGE